jgi:dCMP deaminase
MSRPSFDDAFMAMAVTFSARSTCARLRVGAVIAGSDGRQVFAGGYNGNASGLPNKCDSDEPGACGCLHAEMNAVANCTAAREARKVVYVTDLPCALCAKMIVNLGGVERVVFARDYRLKAGAAVLSLAGVNVERYDLFQLGGVLRNLEAFLSPGE